MEKIKSRKFIVWLVWTALMGGSVFVMGTFDPTMVSWYGAISLIYIGGNVAQKYLFKGGENE